MSPWQSFALPAHRRGFTLVELLVVVLIVGILAAIALPRFLGQRTRSKNAAAQAAARHALVAARSYYTQNSESYAGLGPAQLQGYESSLGTTEPADGQTPGSSANPQNIWIGNGLTGTNPDTVAAGDPNGGNTVTLCSVSKGDTIYCVKDVNGVASYLQAQGTSSTVGSAAGGNFSASGWSSGGGGGGGSSASAIAAGFDHTCALLQGGSVRCWGANANGQLGNGTTTSSSSPVTVSGINNASALAHNSRSLHGCAVIQDGTVQCWGRNSAGQLGDGSTTQRTSPVQVSGITTATAVSSGYEHSCALLANNTIRCWGTNTVGELGNTTLTSSTTPVQVSGITTATAVSAGWSHSCALLSDGTVRCWGYNPYGELGNNTQTGTGPTPVTVSNITTATAVVAAGNHSCALLSSGSVRCWGYNADGQLGDGISNHNNYCTNGNDCNRVPVAVTSISTAVAISTGNYHTCALLAAGTVQCWGNNGSGRLGDGTTTSRFTPVSVAGLSGVTALAAGDTQSCALTGGIMKCWGGNASGQLGDGTTTSSLSPVTVSGL